MKTKTKAQLTAELETAQNRIAELEQTIRVNMQVENGEKERLSLALDAAQAGTWEWELRTNKNTWSAELWKLYGLEPYCCEPSYDVWRDTIHPEDRPQAELAVQTAAQNITEIRTEWRVVDRDGSIRWLMSRGKPILNAEGEAERFLGVVIDITERKLLETSLHDSERRTNLLFLKSTVPVVLLKLPEIVIADVNEAAEKLTGYSRQEMLGRTAVELGLISHKQRTDEIARFEKEHTLAENERRILTKSGGERIVVSNTNPLEIGGQPYAITSLQDITERKQAEEALERTRNTLVEAQKIAHLGSFEYIAATQTTVWSEEEYRIYGLDPSEPSPAYEVMLQKCIHPDDAALLHETFSRAMQTLTAYELEHRVVRPDGSVRWVYDQARPYFDGQGELVRYLGVTLDITERKQANQLLQEARDQFQHLFDLSPIATVFTNLTEGIFVDVNRATETLIGYPRNELIGRSMLEFDIFAVPEERAEILRLLSAQGRVDGVETRIKTKRGVTLTCLMYIETMTLQSRLYSLTQLVDVTEQRKIEKALAETEYKYRTLVEQSPVVVYISESGQQWQYLSPQVESLLGYSPEEYKADPRLWINAIHPDDSKRIQEEAEESLRRGQPVKLEYRMYTRNGRLIWVYDEAYEVTDLASGKSVFHGVFYDITERKWMEYLLEKNERNYRELVQNANSAIIRWRSDGTITFFNEYAQSFFGYSAEEVIGKHVSIIVPQTESSGGDLSGLVKELVAHPEQFINNVNENICKDGRRVWMIWSNRPVYNESGGLEEILAVGSDITESKRMEEELRRSNAELEQFAYIASHDLQEPLRAMAGMVQLLKKRYQGQLDARADEYIGHAVEASTRMQTLIQDLLEYSRVDRRGRPIEAVSAESCLQAALKNLGTAIQESHAEIISDPLPTVHADSTQLTQLFQNLIGNSIKFRGEKEPRVQVTATQLNDSWQFAVRDNGIGIDPQYFERIFLVFQRLHTRREYQGTGIGLALCKKIVERHGGSIWLESHHGEGSTFYFTLPIKE
jgi:PAS domain S-box-containing protein